MPEIYRFYGMVIYMFFNEQPPPHFKVKYNNYEANILLENGQILNGDLPRSKLRLVQDWIEIHKTELREMWENKNFLNTIIYRVTKILEIKSTEIICEINGEVVFQLDIHPLLNKHHHLAGIEKLKNQKVFKTVEIGEMGELRWKNLIFLNGEFWNYDISPEFIVHRGKRIASYKT
ncbi:DUF4160 domain-containing protein [Chryseobacterium sp.]|uniref:DUF4160 domain-containing protein n=1 Tax=Chryseobacterium sp. TaxID=1871047 RepID=UPI0011C94F1B|nr:DUF4160 domain-containing protein [Chryseobacterium sp.]TXF76315.1 DUF4160 domain-containing protein [Chryseobacterium sp.]